MTNQPTTLRQLLKIESVFLFIAEAMRLQSEGVLKLRTRGCSCTRELAAAWHRNHNTQGA